MSRGPMSRHLAGSIVGRSGGSVAFSEASVDSVSHLLRAEQMSARRSIKMISTLSRLAELEGDRQLRIAEKQACRDVHEAAFEALQSEQAAQRAAEAAEAEAQRKARWEAAEKSEEELREAARKKIEAVEERLAKIAKERALQAKKNAARAAEVSARRQATCKAAEDAAESRRAAFKARQDAAANLMREKESLKEIEQRIKDEEAYLRQEARAAAKQRADTQLADRNRNYERQRQVKEEQLTQWQRVADDNRKAKRAEAKARAEHIAAQVRKAETEDMYKRAMIRSGTAAKESRVEAIQIERERLQSSMQSSRHSLRMQESMLRQSLDLLRNKGTAFKVPDSVRASMEVLNTTVRSSMSLTRPLSASPASPSRAGSLARTARPASAAPTMGRTAKGAGHTTGPAAASTLESRKAELRTVLRDEIDKEAERQAILQGTTEPKEVARLNAIFEVERGEAKQKILLLSEQVQRYGAMEKAASASAPAPGATVAAQPVHTSTFRADAWSVPVAAGV